ncbi:MAG TPA: hypothetical protein QGI71_08675 [Dehalococcoidia bacterium]|nr:hypothetical protein [Dehalococcoidia bacterium]
MSQTVLPDSQHAELMSLAPKHATMERDVTLLIFPNDVQTLPVGDENPGSSAGRVPDLDVRHPTRRSSERRSRLSRRSGR